MNDLIISLSIAGLLPLLSLFMLRSDMAIVFFSACAGLVLVGGLDPVVVSTASGFIPGVSESYVRIALLFVPVVLGALLFRHSRRGALTVMGSGFVAILTAFMLWSELPFISNTYLFQGVFEQSAWRIVRDYQTMIVAAGFFTSLMMSKKKG